MELSVIIVNYNTKDLLKRCIDTLLKNAPSCPFEVFVVDNDSKDGSRDYLKTIETRVKVVYANGNLGFSKANNLAILQSLGRYVLLLNPDTEMAESTLDKCLAVMDKNKDIGMLGCKVLLADGTLDLACRRGFPTILNSFFKFSGLAKVFRHSKLFASYNLTYLDENQSYDVDSIVGAFMLVRREVVDTIGLLDEDYFMYGEDIDWCYRAKKAGFRVYYYADAVIIHHKRASSRQSSKAKAAFYNAMKIFYHKHYSAGKSKAVNRIVDKSIDLLAKIK